MLKTLCPYPSAPNSLYLPLPLFFSPPIQASKNISDNFMAADIDHILKERSKEVVFTDNGYEDAEDIFASKEEGAAPGTSLSSVQCSASMGFGGVVVKDGVTVRGCNTVQSYTLRLRIIASSSTILSTAYLLIHFPHTLAHSPHHPSLLLSCRGRQEQVPVLSSYLHRQ